MKKIIKNKKGEKLLSVWWFLILGLVGGAVVGGVWMFFSTDIEVREAEASLLYDKISNCLIDKGYVYGDFFEEDFDFFKYCQLSRNVLESQEFFIKIDVFNSNGELIKNEFFGNQALETDCKIWLDPEVKAEKYPRCVLKEENAIYFKDNEKEILTFEIMTVSNQHGRRISN